MPQETVADLAKEFRMSTDEALEVLVGLGVEVDDVDSPVEEADAEVFRELIAEEGKQRRELQRREKRRKAGDLLAEDIRADMLTDQEILEAKLAADTSAIEVPETITLRALAQLIDVDPGELMMLLTSAGKAASINAQFSADEAIEIAKGFDVRLKPAAKAEEPAAGAVAGKEKRSGVEPCPPVVTVMGHVDHGKTTLLDFVRKANVAAGEAGGITQHIGAYQAEHNGNLITFIDTPGHEAFTEMRARGARVTDIVILIVAADDGINQQTIEAINHAKAADVPIIVAINKCDLPDADPDRVKQQLLEHSLVPEDYGGEIPCVEISALTGDGVDDLLETVLLTAEMEQLTANPRLNPTGTVIEANLDRGRGPVATILVADGTLVKGDCLVVGSVYGKVRTMFNSAGEEVAKAGPATPVEVIGLNDVPAVGAAIEVAKNERRARKLAEEHLQEQKDGVKTSSGPASLEDFLSAVQAGEVDKLFVVLKADVQGSVEAIRTKLEQLKTSDVACEVVYSGVGPIGKTDVDLAKSTGSILIGFNNSVDPSVRTMAEDEGVEIRLYAVIYHLLDDVRQALEGMLEPEYETTQLGRCEVLQLFKITGVGQVAGCKVTQGVMRRGQNIRVNRDGRLVFDGKLDSLKRHTENVNEVVEGLECGIHLNGFRAFAPGDVIECYSVQEHARTLDV